MFIQSLFNQPTYYITWIVLICFSICIHEYAHARVALRRGDSTAADAGYLTLDPLRVMGWQSLLILALFGLAWGAVPIRPDRLRGKFGRLLVALSGPAANLMLALLFFLVMYIGSLAIGPSATIIFICRLGISANIFLFLFNLLPLPMLDGWELYSAFLPAFKRIPQAQANQYGLFGLLIILFMGLHTYLWNAAHIVADLALGMAAA